MNSELELKKGMVIKEMSVMGGDYPEINAAKTGQTIKRTMIESSAP